MEVVSKSTGHKLNLPGKLAEKLLKANKVSTTEKTMPEVKRGRKKKE